MTNVDWLALWAEFAEATDNEQLEIAERIVYHDGRWVYNELSSDCRCAADHQRAGARKRLAIAIAGRLAAMAEHKFKIGQLVYFQLGKRGHTSSGPYQIVRRLPESDGEFHYVIRSTYEDHGGSRQRAN